MTDQIIRCSVGITAYNEEANIGRLLQALLDQQLSTVAISQIVVVASACTDRTEEIVREFMARDPRIELYTQERREGKTSAVNVFLKHATEDICAVESGDTLPGPDTFESLIGMFRDPTVGMTGAHKVPVNTPEHIVGFLTHLRLAMEHNLCLEIPRLGELIAFRKVFDAIPPDVAMDEAFVESLVIKRGLKVVYAPDAVVYNLGPESFTDFVRQRRRNYAGHLYLRDKYGHKVASLDNRLVLKVAWREVKSALWLLYALAVLAMVEALSRVLGGYDYYVRRRTHVVWDMAWSQKGDVGARSVPSKRRAALPEPSPEGQAAPQSRR
ncbi:MAG: glycosyltransferase [Anaerolineae bacterium]|nr:glycosyltransferase [Anaerolineae bacterium]